MSLPKFKAPPSTLRPRRQVEITFTIQAVAAGAYAGVSSGRVSYPFRVVGGSIHFTEEHDYNMGVQFRASTNNQTSTTGHSAGSNLFGRENPSATFRGKGEIKRINTNIEYPGGDLFLKMSVYNQTPYAQDITGSLIVEEM